MGDESQDLTDECVFCEGNGCMVCFGKRITELEKMEEKYNEILQQVQRRHPLETRHETALGYIKSYIRRQGAAVPEPELERWDFAKDGEWELQEGGRFCVYKEAIAAMQEARDADAT